MGFTPVMTDDIQCKEDEDIRLPAGLQIIGKMWDEATILVIADALERQVDWKTLYFEG
jgi:amidase